MINKIERDYVIQCYYMWHDEDRKKKKRSNKFRKNLKEMQKKLIVFWQVNQGVRPIELMWSSLIGRFDWPPSKFSQLDLLTIVLNRPTNQYFYFYFK